MIRKTNYHRWTGKPRPRLVHASIARGIIFKSPFFIFFAYLTKNGKSPVDKKSSASQMFRF